MSTRKWITRIRPEVFLNNRIVNRPTRRFILCRNTLAPSFTSSSYVRFLSDFTIKHIVPPQDAFAERHLGPRKEERAEMVEFLNLKVGIARLLSCCSRTLSEHLLDIH